MPTPNHNYSQLDDLARDMTEVVPPPHEPPTNDPRIVRGSGRWIAVRTGGGQYAVRVEYTTVTGEVVSFAPEGEIRGYPETVANAMRFVMLYAEPGRYNWVAVAR